MTHETPQQRHRRHKRDPYRASQIAPTYTVAPVRCACGHAGLMHAGMDGAGRCVSRACDCTEYREVTP